MRLYVAGHRGMVGQAVVRRMSQGDHVVMPTLAVDHRGPDLRETGVAELLLQSSKPDAVVLTAGRVGGIGANVAKPVEFLSDNILIGVNVINAAHACGIRRLINLGSSCIYPRNCPQPMRPEYLLTGPLEWTNEGYALAKIATLTLARSYHLQYGHAYMSVMPTNLYGTADHYDEQTSHVLPALIMKFERARREGGPVVLWGSGTPLREFLHVDDLADAIALLLENDYDVSEPINVGSGEEVTIAALAEMVADAVGYEGDICWDRTQPDGTPRKLLDSTVIRELGWSPKINLRDGIRRTVAEYCERIEP